MRRISVFVLFIAIASWTQLPARAESPAPIGRAFKNLQHPVDDTDELRRLLGDVAVASRSDLARALQHQTPVKSQADRGTCSIFSSIASIESYLIRSGLVSKPDSVDLSEQWLQYLVARKTAEDGSDAPQNLGLISQWGLAREAVLPYGGEDWAEMKKRPRLARERCGHLQKGRKLKACLLGHFDPDALEWTDEELRGSSQEPLLKARREAETFLQKLQQHAGSWPRATAVRKVSEIKALLRAGVPLVLETDFFLGAWNHREAEEHGIPRDTMKWKEGVISYPPPGSVDRRKSATQEAGHSVLAVGYDDFIEVEVESLQEDGSFQTFRYRGVYFIKNSWGTDGFGSEFSAQGVQAPGYGMITQKYAHEFGGFYRLQLPESSR
jgi:hypothetical protein